MALDLLFAVAELDKPLTVRELSRRLGWPRSSIQRTLAVLESYGLLVQDQTSHFYHLGPSLLMLATRFLSQNDLSSVGTQIVRSLRDQLDETSSIQVRVGVRRVPIVIAQCTHELQYVLSVGSSYPLYAGAAGKVLVAFAEDTDLIDAVVAEVTRYPEPLHTKFDPQTYLQDVARVREQGYAISRDERVEGSVGVAAPVFNSSSEVLCALTVHGPALRMNERALNVALQSVLAKAKDLSVLAANQSPLDVRPLHLRMR